MDNILAETSTADAAAPVATASTTSVERHCARCGGPVAADRPWAKGEAGPVSYCCCAWDGCAKLTGRQQKFASDRCRCADHDHNFPRLGKPPIVPAGRSIDRLVEIASDGKYRSVVELAHETGCNPMTVYRRIRESVTGRRGRRVARFTWVSRPRAHRGRSRILEYQLVLNPQAAA